MNKIFNIVSTMYKKLLVFMIFVNGLFFLVSLSKVLFSIYPGSLAYISIPVSLGNIILFVKELIRK